MEEKGEKDGLGLVQGRIDCELLLYIACFSTQTILPLLYQSLHKNRATRRDSEFIHSEIQYSKLIASTVLYILCIMAIEDHVDTV